MSDLPKCTIAIIGGTGVYSLDGLENVKDIDVDTPFGKPSLLKVGTIFGEQIAFVARHGTGHKFLPTEVPFRANIFALKMLGVRYAFAVSACGSLQEHIAPGELVLVDQFIDKTKYRKETFFGNGIAGHVEFGHPVCKKFMDLAEKVIGEALPETKLHVGGTYVCMEGPAFSTQAESRLHKSWGASVIGMTAATEAKLVREAEIAYCLIGLVTDFDAWKEGDHVDVASVFAILKANAGKAQIFTKAVAKAVHENKFDSAAHSCLASGLMTKPESVTEEQRKAFKPLFEKYGW
ncbi:S-methyl-5prime-thioadenosine phosphorylase [Diplonema papillatum]|nr:S-methyl-5prime-thioadenosine phosphorylase [Diplonema papillatum]